MGTRILINDGVIELKAEKITATDIVCKVISGGTLSNNNVFGCKSKGISVVYLDRLIVNKLSETYLRTSRIHVPGVELSMPYLSERDMSDLEFGSKLGFDFIAASFVDVPS